MPKVSILMPMKDAASYVAQCLDSIVEQDLTDWELIVVNDRSSDQSADLVERFANKDLRIKLVANQGQGIVSALQTGFESVRGLFITRMDADDLMPPGRLSLMTATLEEGLPRTVVTGKARYFSDQPISAGYQKYEDWLNERVEERDHWKWIYRECVIASPNWMMRTEEFPLATWEDLRYPEDYDLVLHWYKNGFHIHPLKETTLRWREHDQRTSKTSPHYNQASFFRLKVLHFNENEIGTGDRVVLCGTNHKGKLIARELLNLGVTFRWMSHEHDKHQAGIYDQKIEPFNLSGLSGGSKLIIAFHPEQAMTNLQHHMDQYQLAMGRDYWIF